MSAKYDISYPCGLPGGLENFSKTWCGEATVDRCTNLWTLYMSRNSVRGGWTLKSLVNAQEMAEFGEREGWDSHVCVPFLGTIVPPSLPPVSNYQLFDSRTSGGNITPVHYASLGGLTYDNHTSAGSIKTNVVFDRHLPFIASLSKLDGSCWKMRRNMGSKGQ